MLKLYSLYHLNLAYSSIEESRRAEVIKKCFWPLIELAVENNVPLAVEVPAYTLEVAAELDPAWVDSLVKAVSDKKIELIGAGYSQMIFPLVPHEVNQWNLQIGKQLYKEIIHQEPAIWYINEQAYSPSIIESFNSIGASAVVMEWNNPRSTHDNWNDELRYHAQSLTSRSGDHIPVIWNDSISFQKFQRYAHNDMSLNEYLEFIHSHISKEAQDRYFCLYGNDAEIFDFRPGRFRTEPTMGSDSEWKRITKMYQHLSSDPDVALCFPSEVLNVCNSEYSQTKISLETAADPIPVKKQQKYNVTRWATTGRDSITINSKCFTIFRLIKELGKNDSVRAKQYQKELCYLWSSDFRTHITEQRWAAYVERLEAVSVELKKLTQLKNDSDRVSVHVSGLVGEFRTNHREKSIAVQPETAEDNWYTIQRDEKYCVIKTSFADVKLDLKKGMAIEHLVFKMIDSMPLIGNIPHGYYTDIKLGADWFSMNTVLQIPGKSQITDLAPVQLSFEKGTGVTGEFIQCKGIVATELGTLTKLITIHKDFGQIDVAFKFDWPIIPRGSLKTAIVCLSPSSFDSRNLFYATHNGGKDFESYHLQNTFVQHDKPSSSIVSATSGLGATEGIVVAGDTNKAIAVRFNQSLCSAMPMVNFWKAAPSYFFRILFSCGEMDESRVQDLRGPLEFECSIIGLNKQEPGKFS
ncbi:MAG: hypothetical protein WCX28_12005 [Bacteriovoracaceae bacterium]